MSHDDQYDEEVQIAAQSHSVLNINGKPEGMMRVEWLFSKNAINDETMHAIIRQCPQLDLDFLLPENAVV